MFGFVRRLRIFRLPALLAASVIVVLPLLHQLHLAQCGCGGGSGTHHCAGRADGYSHDNASVHFRRLVIEGGIADRNQCRAECTPKTPPHRHHHNHDSSTCPVCQMFLALAKGFTGVQAVALPSAMHICLEVSASEPAIHISICQSAKSTRAPPTV